MARIKTRFAKQRWRDIAQLLMFSAFFAALGIAQSGPPSLSGELRIMAGPIAQSVSDHSATVFWLTSRDALMSLSYGSAAAQLDQMAATEAQAGTRASQEHRVRLKNLEPNKTYFFQILDHHGAVRAKGQFQTEDSGYAQDGLLKITDGPVFEYLDNTSVEIAWTTNAQSSTLVRYGTDPNDLRKTAEAPWGQETHRVTITGLEPNATYYFVVESGQASDSGTMAKSNEGSFHTEYQGEAALTNIEPRR